MAIKLKKPTKQSVKKTVKLKMPKNKIVAPLFIMGRYFKGSWAELRKVRWPNRRTTWGMTAAVLVFTAMFVALIVLLDAMFSQLFKLIIK